MDRLAPLPPELTHIKVVATDMDGTLTRRGRFSSTLLDALEHLQRAGITVIIVTGRSAGWVQGVQNYLPVWGAIAENGGVLLTPNDEPIILADIHEVSQHRTALRQTFQSLQSRFPSLRESSDNPFRITDWTFSVHGLTPDDLSVIQQQVEAASWSFTYSTVQCHIKPQGQNKAQAISDALHRHFPQVSPAAVVTVGDSLNDESMFDADRFPYSVGVANIQHYGDRLQHRPAYMTRHPEVEGFCELVRAIGGSG